MRERANAGLSYCPCDCVRAPPEKRTDDRDATGLGCPVQRRCAALFERSKIKRGDSRLKFAETRRRLSTQSTAAQPPASLSLQ